MMRLARPEQGYASNGAADEWLDKEITPSPALGRPVVPTVIDTDGSARAAIRC
jgi:hypothetical protein